MAFSPSASLSSAVTNRHPINRLAAYKDGKHWNRFIPPSFRCQCTHVNGMMSCKPLSFRAIKILCAYSCISLMVND